VLASAHRLRRSSDFAAAVRGGRRAGRGAVVVHLSIPAQQHDQPAPAGSEVSPARAGFVVSKAVGNAVTRNKVKRRLRHLVAERLDALPPGTTVVVRAQQGAHLRTYPELAADLDAALAAARSPRRSRGPRRDGAS
jgi:ribonuclease P protein component